MTLLAVAVLTAACIVATARWRSVWAQSGRSSERKPGWWPYGLPFWRGYLRAAPVSLAGCMFMLVGAWAGVLNDGSVRGNAIVAALVVIGFAGLMVCFALTVFIVLINRTKALVPPSLRRQTGGPHSLRQRHRH